MTNNELTFNDLPQVVAELRDEVSGMKALLLNLINKENMTMLPKSFSTINQGCEAYGLKKPHPRAAEAYFRDAANADAQLQKVMLWFPNAQNTAWHNCYSEKGKTIVECPSTPKRLDRHVEETLEADMVRITYLKDRYQEEDGYRYVGLYKLDKETTCKRHLCVWNRLEENTLECTQLIFPVLTLYVPIGAKEKYEAEATEGWNVFKGSSIN